MQVPIKFCLYLHSYILVRRCEKTPARTLQSNKLKFISYLALRFQTETQYTSQRTTNIEKGEYFRIFNIFDSTQLYLAAAP